MNLDTDILNRTISGAPASHPILVQQAKAVGLDPGVIPLSGVPAGLLTRKALAAKFPNGGVCERTLFRWEQAAPDPLPVIKIGRVRLYDWEAVRAWILRHQHQAQPEARGPGRPRRAA